MKPTRTNDQMSWAKKNHTWYVRGDSATRKALKIASQYGMNTDQTMLLVQLITQEDLYHLADDVRYTPQMQAFEAVVNKTLDILFDPKAMDVKQDEYAIFNAMRKLMLTTYINALNPQRVDAIMDGSFRLAGQKAEDA